MSGIMRIGDYLDRHAADHPEREAVRCSGTSLTYSGLAAQVEICARAMLAAGLRAGDRVAVLSAPRTEVMVTFLAAAKIGVMWLGLNPKYQLPELDYIVSDAKPAALFGISRFEGREYKNEVEELRHRHPSIRLTVGFDADDFYDETFVGWTGGAGLADTGSYRDAVDEVAVEAPALLVYTSGSSGRPKGVILRQRELVRRSRTQNEQFSVSPYPRLLNPLPINHIGGMHFLSLYTFIGGGTLIYCDRFSPDAFIEALKRKEINIVYTLPTMVQMMAEKPEFSVSLLDDLQWFVFSGAAMPKELVDLLFRAKCKVGLTYGMTETCGSVTYAIKTAENCEVLTHTIGRPTPEGEVRVSREDGSLCAAGETGEIQVRAEFCMGGYFNRPEATAEAYTADGWLRTGDTALLRADGNIEFVGRRSEMFKSGGYNVYPREIELALETHPDVLLSAVIGVPDPLFNAVGWAYIVPRPGSRLDGGALKEWCSKVLANYKIPKRFTTMNELPMLPIGKVDKIQLKALAREEAR